MTSQAASPSLIKKMLVIVPLLLVLMSAVGNIVMAAHVSDIGSKVSSLEYKYQSMKKHNDDLSLELAQARSLKNLTEEAKLLGFIPVTSMVFVDNPQLAKAN